MASGFSTRAPTNMRFLQLQRNNAVSGTEYTRFDAVWNYVVYGPLMTHHVVVATIATNFVCTLIPLVMSYSSLATDNMYYAAAWLFVIFSGALSGAWLEEWVSTLARDADTQRVHAQQNAARSVLCSLSVKWLILGGFVEVFTSTYKYNLDTNTPKILYSIAGWTALAVGGAMWVVWTMYWSKRGFGKLEDRNDDDDNNEF